MTERILVVDDEADLLELVEYNLKEAGYSVTAVKDGASALAEVRRQRPDLIVLDLMLPDIPGTEVCKRLRRDPETESIPIMMLTARGSEVDRVVGFELGADDYVVKPFSTRVLLARVSALLRRNQARALSSPPAEAVTVGGLSLDADRMEARFKGVLLTLTLTEFRLLEAFARRPGIVLSRDRLLEIVRGDESVVVERIVDTYVKRIRRKLEAVDATFDGIETVIGAGYRLRG